MVLENYELWRQTGKKQKGSVALFHEDPFELAIEEASMKLLRTVCNIFHKGNATVSSSKPTKKLHNSCTESSCKLQTRQHMRRGVYGAPSQFATASLTFAPVNNKCQQEEDNKEDAQRGIHDSSNQFARTNLSFAPMNNDQQDEDAKEYTQRAAYEPFNQLAIASSKFAINKYQQNEDAQEHMQRGVFGPSNQSATTNATLAPINKYHQDEDAKDLKPEINHPSGHQLLSHPLALLSYIPKDASLFFAGAVAGATAKTVTAPLDRIKLLMQVHGVKATQEIRKKSIGFLEAAAKIGKEEGMQGFWKGNLPQVIRVIPYSAVQLLSYELYKKLFKGNDKELSVASRLAAGACAGMTSTLVTYPLDVLRLRLAVDPACKSMGQVASTMLREEGLASFYRGLGPSLIGIAPYIALNFCAFDLIKKSLPEDIRKTSTASFLTAFLSATLATTMCYPLDTVRRQLQMKGTPYMTVLDAFPGIIAQDGLLGLYRGFVPNALKNLPNSRLVSCACILKYICSNLLNSRSIRCAHIQHLFGWM
eukprot:c24345_g1_i2 orf=163-1767(-)